MTLTTDKVHGELDFSDLLFRNPDGTSGYHSNQSCYFTIPEIPNPEGSSAADDFLDTLLRGSDSSSAPASPLWSPSTTDSGINEEPTSESTESPHPSRCTAVPHFNAPIFSQPPPVETQLPPNGAVDQSWDSDNVREHGISYYLTTGHALSNQTLTVKDLLLSNLGQKTQQISQHPLPELELDEDEKILLAKEGVKLPSKLPLSKFEEKVLKKIRRKIRNKRSAQESRKKRREYVDSLEERMSACSAHNLKLQRKIEQLEETNTALLEQLNQLHALLSSSSGKTSHRGTCILVLLLSLSLLVSSNLQPEPYSQLSQGEYTEAKVLSRSLLSVDETQDVHPEGPSPASSRLYISRSFEVLSRLNENLWTWTKAHTVVIRSSNPHDFRHPDDH
ncbi:cyclic AMP-responsive element-binding protein 3-like protein 3-B isoform X2 [Cynoglossus semilaevis]|uniref:cyclic AMP-responsive element-binding protein 3-like protein 3-B isoform X2 n=1 Tax=Cynoglossus semilaevis TaxID=244447 RepID=UPI00049545E9|nr:cyclic AMP-responsive element-binding protein 3-like protein 3-B isoform X2 [Cynoglossus semilaevis]